MLLKKNSYMPCKAMAHSKQVYYDDCNIGTIFTIHEGRGSLYGVVTYLISKVPAHNKLAMSPQQFRNLTGVYELVARMFRVYEIQKRLMNCL